MEKYLDRQELLNGLADGLRGTELGEVQFPPRPKLSVDKVLAWVAASHFAVEEHRSAYTSSQSSRGR